MSKIIWDYHTFTDMTGFVNLAPNNQRSQEFFFSEPQNNCLLQPVADRKKTFSFGDRIIVPIIRRTLAANVWIKSFKHRLSFSHSYNADVWMPMFEWLIQTWAANVWMPGRCLNERCRRICTIIRFPVL